MPRSKNAPAPPPPTERVPAFDQRPAGHAYTCGLMEIFVKMVLSAIGYRAAARALKIVSCLLPGGDAPSANGGQHWLLRLGLYELQRPKEPADDWVWLIDHTIHTGNGKCLLVVGVRLSVWNSQRVATLEQDPQASFALRHQDLSVFQIELMESCTGEAVAQQLEQLADQTGITPCAILSDQGPDVRPGARGFCQKAGRSTVLVHDLAHGVANALKRTLQNDPTWAEFLADANRSKTQIRQTAYAFLMPPELKNKSRWMNLEPLVAWSGRVQQFLRDPQAALARAGLSVDLGTLEQKMGWLRRYAAAIDGWSIMLEAAAISLKYIRNHGYHERAHEELGALLAGFREGPTAALVAEILQFVQTQGEACGTRRLPGSTEVLESLIGRGKQLMGRNKNGYTKTVLAMAAAVMDITTDTIQAALQTVKVTNVRQWIHQKLGISLPAQRQRALALPAGGTKTR